MVYGNLTAEHCLWFFFTGYLKNMHHPEDKVFIIHVSELTHSGSIGKSDIDDSLFMVTNLLQKVRYASWVG